MAAFVRLGVLGVVAVVARTDPDGPAMTDSIHAIDRGAGLRLPVLVEGPKTTATLAPGSPVTLSTRRLKTTGCS